MWRTRSGQGLRCVGKREGAVVLEYLFPRTISICLLISTVLEF